MTDISVEFEKLIHRIHQLVEQKGSEVIWNDKIPDPDNPEQSRQIDISIKRDGKITLIECRIHQKPQDVKWIEELIGRRLSLRADALIAVSNSGFTSGAIKKANEFGIILRDLQSLTQQEVEEWGLSTRITLNFLNYDDIEITLFTDENHRHPSVSDVVSYFNNTPFLLLLFQSISQQLDKPNRTTPIGQISMRSPVEKMSISGIPIVAIEISAYISNITTIIDTPSVVAYDAPSIDSVKREVFVETIGKRDFQITQSSNRVIMIADLSCVKSIPNRQFLHFETDFGRVVCMEDFKYIGLPEFKIQLTEVKINFALEMDSSRNTN